ncbi:hypothetical protein [Alkalilimnicola ehrlichii]|uniref:Uncharacterized protein n=1 Tax=Alkalilimnicola ehrlichii TaxID=351052 RepID=A0A3E0WMB9_9GAMM|nr:hypothetical protein [Alkalilimnicola ehrlichii]RFA34120.1 hypothetical protein CAL65_15850 [Alkalilimnicola ehrlichii]
MGDDRYRIESSEPVADDFVVLVNLGCCIAGIQGAALGEPLPAMLNAYRKGQDLNPASAEQVVGRMQRALPDNEDVAELHRYWVRRLAQREASRHYEFIEGIWATFERAEDLETRIETLQHVRRLAENYLNDHPDGLEREQVEQLHREATGRLEI